MSFALGEAYRREIATGTRAVGKDAQGTWVGPSMDVRFSDSATSEEEAFEVLMRRSRLAMGSISRWGILTSCQMML